VPKANILGARGSETEW